MHRYTIFKYLFAILALSLCARVAANALAGLHGVAITNISERSFSIASSVAPGDLVHGRGFRVEVLEGARARSAGDNTDSAHNLGIVRLYAISLSQEITRYFKAAGLGGAVADYFGVYSYEC